MYNYLYEVESLLEEILDSYQKAKTKKFYRSKINNFFNAYMSQRINENKPLNAITYFDINVYLDELKYSDADKLNHYMALKKFFNYTYIQGITSDVMKQVTMPSYIKPIKQVVEEEHYKLLKKFIFDRDNNIRERLALGLFLFTGLSRQYLFQLRNKQFSLNEGVYYIYLWKDDEEIMLPLKAEMQILINEYLMILSPDDINKKVIDKSEDYLSTYISNLCEKACGKKYTPTILSSTFISKALIYGKNIWEISKLTLESISTIEEHLKDDENLIHKQTAILNSF